VFISLTRPWSILLARCSSLGQVLSFLVGHGEMPQGQALHIVVENVVCPELLDSHNTEGLFALINLQVHRIINMFTH
jgi:hypothetical protein